MPKAEVRAPNHLLIDLKKDDNIRTVRAKG